MIQELIKTAIEAGEAILKYRGGALGTELKQDQSPVTLADHEANEIILKALKKLDASIPIVSEESKIEDYSVRKNWKKLWMVDPLDGTKEFIEGGDDFTVNIALIENGIPILGIVYIPATNALYYGSREEGSFKNGKRIYSEPPHKNEALIVAESKSRKTPETDEYLKQFKIKERISIGSSTKFCMLAEGTAHLHPRFTETMEWDTAAGDAVFRYSGKGSPRKSPLVYNKESLKNPKYIVGLE